MKEQRTLRVHGVRVWVVAAACAAGLVACGDSAPPEDDSEQARMDIERVIKTAAASTDPADCTRLMTQRFLDQSELAKGRAAVESCREDAPDVSEKPREVTVSNISVDAAEATATAAFTGGELDGQHLDLSLIRRGDGWKLDHIDSFAKFDRKRFLRAGERSFARDSQVPRETASCMIDRIDGLDDRAIQRLFLKADPRQFASLLGPCFVSLLRRQLSSQPGVPPELADCVVDRIDKPPYEALRRIFRGADAAGLFADIARSCARAGVS